MEMCIPRLLGASCDIWTNYLRSLCLCYERPAHRVAEAWMRWCTGHWWWLKSRCEVERWRCPFGAWCLWLLLSMCRVRLSLLLFLVLSSIHSLTRSVLWAGVCSAPLYSSLSCICWECQPPSFCQCPGAGLMLKINRLKITSNFVLIWTEVDLQYTIGLFIQRTSSQNYFILFYRERDR